MSKAFGIIYVHINKRNGKCYVGQTCQDPKRRWRKESNVAYSYRSCTVFYRALQKYGWKAFKTIQLVSCTNQLDLDFYEEYFINLYSSVAPNGYNSLNRANGKVVYTEEVKRKMSEKAKQRKKVPLSPQMKKRNEHVYIDGVEMKICSGCKEAKLLSEYNKYSITWDGLNRYCKVCHRQIYTKWKKANPTPKVSKEHMSELRRKQNAYRKTLPNYDAYLEKLRKANIEPLYARHIKTGIVLSFVSGREAEKHGFRRTAISTAITKQKPYKGYLWSHSNN